MTTFAFSSVCFYLWFLYVFSKNTFGFVCVLELDHPVHLGRGALVVDEQLEVRLADLVAPVVEDVARPGAALHVDQLAGRRVLELDGGQRRQVVLLKHQTKPVLRK